MTAGITPTWFIEAINTPATARSVSVRGANIHYCVWNPGAERVVVLVHGAAANTHWWDHIAPFIAQGLRVAAVDLSGHGDSEWRDDYSLTDWAHEVAAVMLREAGPDNCVLVAHSLGGTVSQELLHLKLAVPRGLIILDTPIRQRSPDEVQERMARAKPSRVFESRTEAIRAYRTRPHQLVTLPYIRHHVAEQSLRAAQGGWSWKFDPRIYMRAEQDVDTVGPLPCPGVLVRAGQGSIDPETQRQMVRRWGGTVSSFDIPDAGHHLMFDVPLALLTAVQGTLHGWGFARS